MKNAVIILLFFLTGCTENTPRQGKSLSNSIGNISLIKNISIVDPNNTLSGKTAQLQLEYIAWGCACANWITPADRRRYADSGLAEHCIFIEPADTTLLFPAYFDATKHSIIVGGQFYVKKGYPRGTILTEEHLDKAKVFRYTSLRVVDKNTELFTKVREQKLELSYANIACTCAQWCESKYVDQPYQKTPMYLERNNSNLVNADTLYNGTHFPLKVSVTGYFITNSGYPENYAPVKGEPQPAKVFRYSKIKVVSPAD